MVDLETQRLEDILRHRIGRFLCDKQARRLPYYTALQRICEYDRNAFLCGGAVRDILLSNRHNRLVPRDLDIVLGYADLNEVADSFVDYVKKWNCYGGVSIQVRDWSLDLWRLAETWAYKEKHVAVNGFDDFPKTTFLDIDAVAVQLFKRKKQKRRVYSRGFFEAILKKTIEINLEDNPNPAMCIVRSLKIANNFKFAIGPKLAAYIAHYADQIELEEIVRLYRARYQPTVSSIEVIDRWIETIKEQIRVSGKRSVRLHASENKADFHPVGRSTAHKKDARLLFVAK